MTNEQKIQIKSKIGWGLVIAWLLFTLVYNFIVTGITGEDFSRDIFGNPIPTPPLWTSYIPFVGILIGFIFECFSLHGLVWLIITIVLFFVASLFLKTRRDQ